ncbi:hypothetical protein N4R57_21730 [Rhodobacteraceae bacterium D3-12]|nr:hypothetical protein N4R57_21730 [Rhodobacteraceae bacterium D3-12]
MTLGIAYVVFVLIGPVIFLALIRPMPTRRRFALGVGSALMLVIAAWVLQGSEAGMAVQFARLGCIWLGWIVTIAMVVQALALRRGGGRQRKWNAALGAAATVMPWFGLTLAISAAG